MRDECLSAHEFMSIAGARRKIDAWWADYNLHRTQSALGDVSPTEFLRKTKARTDKVAKFQV